MIRDTEGRGDDKEVVANGFKDSDSAAAAQTSSADLEDMEEGEVEDEVHENGFEAEVMPKAISEVGHCPIRLSFVS